MGAHTNYGEECTMKVHYDSSYAPPAPRIEIRLGVPDEAFRSEANPGDLIIGFRGLDQQLIRLCHHPTHRRHHSSEGRHSCLAQLLTGKPLVYDG